MELNQNVREPIEEDVFKAYIVHSIYGRGEVDDCVTFSASTHIGGNVIQNSHESLDVAEHAHWAGLL